MTAPVRPKIKRLVQNRAETYQGVASLNAYSTAYVMASTLQFVFARLAAALEAGKVAGASRGDGLLAMRDACIDAAGVLMACAEQAERDRDAHEKAAGGAAR